MPPYYPAGLTIILETHDAGALETANVTANTGAEARQLLAQAELALSSGERLSEEVVDCLAEQGEGALKFFGKHQTMPFYCVAVNRRPPFVLQKGVTAWPAANRKQRFRCPRVESCRWPGERR